MPALSPTMERGSLSKWHVKEGDDIFAGDILAEIETDKAIMEFESVEDGKITKIIVPEGSTNIEVNSVIAELTTDDTAMSSVPENINNTVANNVKKTHPKGDQVELKPQEKAPEVNTSERKKISPLARKLATKHNIDIENLAGSGPYGRIIKIDITNFLSSPKRSDNEDLQTKKTADKPSHDEVRPDKHNIKALLEMYNDCDHEVIPTNGMRRLVATRLTEAKRSIPHFYLRRSIYMDKLIKLRLELNGSFQNKEIHLSINDFIIKACAKSLQDNPKCNAIWADQNVIQLKSSDVAVAVALEEGLITPIIRDAEKKGLQDISSEMKNKAQKAREKKLLPEEYTGGSFSISNLGMMGIENFDAVINPPQASILAVGSCIKKPLINEAGELCVGHTMSITLSADHRIIDGAAGALFLNSIVDYLSNPLKLLI